MEMMCATCGFEPTDVSTPNREHKQFDPAHDPNWYIDGLFYGDVIDAS